MKHTLLTQAGGHYKTNCLLFKTIGSNNLRLAKLLNSCSSNFPVTKSFQTYLGQNLEVLNSHRVQSTLETKGHQWLTGGHLLKYHALLLDTPNVILKICPAFWREIRAFCRDIWYPCFCKKFKTGIVLASLLSFVGLVISTSPK